MKTLSEYGIWGKPSKCGVVVRFGKDVQRSNYRNLAIRMNPLLCVFHP